MDLRDLNHKACSIKFSCLWVSWLHKDTWILIAVNYRQCNHITTTEDEEVWEMCDYTVYVFSIEKVHVCIFCFLSILDAHKTKAERKRQVVNAWWSLSDWNVAFIVTAANRSVWIIFPAKDNRGFSFHFQLSSHRRLMLSCAAVMESERKSMDTASCHFQAKKKLCTMIMQLHSPESE